MCAYSCPGAFWQERKTMVEKYLSSQNDFSFPDSRSIQSQMKLLCQQYQISFGHTLSLEIEKRDEDTRRDFSCSFQETIEQSGNVCLWSSSSVTLPWDRTDRPPGAPSSRGPWIESAVMMQLRGGKRPNKKHRERFIYVTLRG